MNSSPKATAYFIDGAKCFRCAACSSIAPGLFVMGATGPASFARDPESGGEWSLTEAARTSCPAFAIGRKGPLLAEPSPAPGFPNDLFPLLFNEAERVRFRLTDIPFDAIEKDKVTSAYVRFIKEVALSELTTFSATRRFMTEMADDPDFSNWVAIWFYEESKHPEALFRWLAAFGQRVDPKTLMKSRVSAPFLRSRVGTLVMNILSELFASAGYQDIARNVKEPVLAQITRYLAGDEARHCASFYAFTARAIVDAKNPELERLQALKVLYYWVQAGSTVEHPVNQFHAKIMADPELATIMKGNGTDYGPVLSRACKLIGTLIGVPLSHPDEVLGALREASARLGQ